MKEPLLGVIGLRVRADIYYKWMELPESRKDVIRSILRSTLEELLSNELPNTQQTQQQEYRVVVEHKMVYTEDERLKIIERLEKCRAELASYKMKAIELEEELQAKTKQLEELKKRLEESPQELEEKSKTIEELKHIKSNLEELVDALWFCLQNHDCDTTKLAHFVKTRLKRDPIPTKLYQYVKVK